MQLRKNRFTSDILGNEEIRHFSGWKFRGLNHVVNLANSNVLTALLGRRKRVMLKPRGLIALLHDIFNR